MPIKFSLNFEYLQNRNRTICIRKSYKCLNINRHWYSVKIILIQKYYCSTTIRYDSVFSVEWIVVGFCWERNRYARRLGWKSIDCISVWIYRCSLTRLSVTIHYNWLFDFMKTRVVCIATCLRSMQEEWDQLQTILAMMLDTFD